MIKCHALVCKRVTLTISSLVKPIEHSYGLHSVTIKLKTGHIISSRKHDGEFLLASSTFNISLNKADIMKKQVYNSERLLGQVFPFHHRGVH